MMNDIVIMCTMTSFVIITDYWWSQCVPFKKRL